MSNEYHLLSRELGFVSYLAWICEGNTMAIAIQEFIYVEVGF